MTITAVHHINCATMCPLAGGLLGIKRLVAHCLVLETAKDGLVLVDTGFGTRDVEGLTKLSRGFKPMVRPALDPNETAVAQITALGFSPNDVKHVVVTHLDLDHAGGLVDFPKATVHLHAREHAAAMTPATSKEKNRYIAAHWAHGPQWSVYTESGDTWRGLPAVTKLRGVDADIGILPMHGHTRGHSAIIAHHADRWLVHAGDAYFHRNEVADPRGKVPLGLRAFERMMAMELPNMRASQGALRQLKLSYPDIALFCAHDPEELHAFSGAAA